VKVVRVIGIAVALIVVCIVAAANQSVSALFIGLLFVFLFLVWSRSRRRIARLEADVALLAARVLALEPKQEAAPQPEPVIATAPAVVVAPEPIPQPEPAAALPEELPAAPPIPPLTAEPRPSWTSSIRSALDVEQMLGANWLSKIGVAILVLGIAFFLAWQLRELGPAGKITVGVIVSGALLGAGVWGERRERFRILARAAIGGGWALLFFVSYAAHQVAAARVIDSALAGFAVMLLVAAAMVAHTLRYRSQVVTGLAFALAFTTVAINRVDVTSLWANVVLAIGFTFVVVRMRWYKLEILGILATYANHFLWLVPIIAPMHGKVRPFPQFYASAAILLSYWAVYRASYVVRKPDDERDSAFAAVLYSAALLAVMKYQSAHPELAFRALLALGAIELGLSLLPNCRRRRTPFVILTTVAVTCLVAAFPLRFAAGTVTPIWLLEAALLFVTGVILNERVYRRLGMIAGVATAVQFLGVPAARLLGARLGGGYPRVHEWIVGSIAVAMMLAFYAAAEWLPRRRSMLAHPFDHRLAFYLSYLGAVMAVVAGWALFPIGGAAVFWISVAVALAAIGGRDLAIQANLLAIATVIRVLAVNLTTPVDRVVTVLLVAAAIYALSRWNALPFVARMPQAARWIASGLLALLAWYQLSPVAVGVAWAILGIALLEAGERLPELRLHAYVALACAFARVFIVNLNAAGDVRVLTVVAIAVALLYAWFPDRPLFAWLAAACVVALLRFELRADVVAVAWAALALLLVALSLTGRRVFLHIGLAVAVATLIRGVLHNLYERSWFPPPNAASTWLLVGGTAALLVASLPFAFRLRNVEPITGPRKLLRWLDARPEQLLLFAPLILITALLGTEIRHGMLTVAWGIEAVVVFVAALWVGERSYRLCGLALLLLCVGKIFVSDFWLLSLRDKALTGIVVGVALIGVSILYTRKREAILQFL